MKKRKAKKSKLAFRFKSPLFSINLARCWLSLRQTIPKRMSVLRNPASGRRLSFSLSPMGRKSSSKVSRIQSQVHPYSKQAKLKHGSWTPFNLINSRALNAPGIYRIYWKHVSFRTVGAKREKVELKSNEVLVLREKNTPYIDPETGYTITPKD